MLRKSRIDNLRMKAMELADKEYQQKIEISQPPQGFMPLLNHKCHVNAVNAVKQGLASAVVECVIIDSCDCTAHYINMMEDGSYVDLTLGWVWSGSDYRFCRVVPESEYSTIYDSLGRLKAKICERHLSWIDRLLSIGKWDIS